MLKMLLLVASSLRPDSHVRLPGHLSWKTFALISSSRCKQHAEQPYIAGFLFMRWPDRMHSSKQLSLGMKVERGDAPFSKPLWRYKTSNKNVHAWHGQVHRVYLILSCTFVSFSCASFARKCLTAPCVLHPSIICWGMHLKVALGGWSVDRGTM